MKIRKIIALGIAGCLVWGTTVMAAPVVEVSAPDKATVVTAAESIKIKDGLVGKEIQEKNDFVEIDIKYPVISDLSDAKFQAELNALIEKQVATAKDDMEVQAKEYEQLVKENDWEIRQHQLFTEYDLMANNDDILSFTMTYYTYTGGANGMTAVEYYNIDKKANKSIKLADLFNDEADYIKVINKEIVKQIELRSKDEAEMFFEGEMGFQTITEDQGFYLQDQDLVIAFAKYEIAPGAMGIPEFVMNLANLKDHVNVKDNSKIVINGTEIKTILDQDKQVTKIHLRSVAEILGYKVDWNGGEQSILLTKEQATAKMTIGDNIYIANHKIPYELEAAPVIINGSTYVPVSFLETVLLYKF